MPSGHGNESCRVLAAELFNARWCKETMIVERCCCVSLVIAPGCDATVGILWQERARVTVCRWVA